MDGVEVKTIRTGRHVITYWAIVHLTPLILLTIYTIRARGHVLPQLYIRIGATERRII